MYTFTLFFFLYASLVMALPLPRSVSQIRSLNHIAEPDHTNSQSSTSNPLLRRDNNTQKYVVAHFMVGNAYPYTVANWASDIALAHSAGIDGFALNVGSDVWQPQRVDDAFTAAANSGTDFKLFLSFDMSVLPCSDPSGAATLRTYITKYATHPNQMMYNGRVFASTFSGETCTFGQSSVSNGWSSQFTQHPDLTGANAVFFVPSFFADPATFNSFDQVMDGAFNWNSGWPIQLTTSSAGGILSGVGASLGDLTKAGQSALSNVIGSTTSDDTYRDGLNAMNGGKVYMGAVSPWFFTHYGANTYNKNWIYLADSHLYPTRWENLVSARDNVDIVEIVTWNDYGESHYIGPIEGAQPNSQAWVNGFDHTAWLNMTSYYATAFKTGSYPAIARDQIYVWARPHPKDATASSDSVPKPDNFELTEDALWAVVMTTQPSTITLSTTGSDAQTFNVQSGVTKLSIPLTPGGSMHGKIERNGALVVELNPDFTFEPNPSTYNYNAFVAMAVAS